MSVGFKYGLTAWRMEGEAVNKNNSHGEDEEKMERVESERMENATFSLENCSMNSSISIFFEYCFLFFLFYKNDNINNKNKTLKAVEKLSINVRIVD